MAHWRLFSWLAQVSQAHDFDIRNLSNDMVFEATEPARTLGMCGNHLWSLAVATGHDKDIPILLRDVTEPSNDRNGYTRTWCLHDHGSKPYPRAATVPYVAISHVWLEGTGAGVQK